jgi:ComEC/Rec2-related protein
MGFVLKFILLGVLVVLLCGGALLYAFNKKHRFGAFVALLAVCAILLATLSSFLFISLPSRRAKDYLGSYSAEVEIISAKYKTEYSSEYSARLRKAGEGDTNIKVHLICDFPSDFDNGDRIIATVRSDICEYYGNSLIDRDSLLILETNSADGIMYREAEGGAMFLFDFLRGIVDNINDIVCHYIDDIFEGDSALVKGMLLNDKSDLSSYTRAQFSRSGAAHLLAVSGLHISLLLGALELLLKKLFVPKKLRVVIISLGGLIFLLLTDFSLSAARSVFMLFGVYIGFIMSEDNDAPTSLFCSVAFITLISPHSVTDIGMWMSFFATLGLVVVYPFLERKLPYIEKSRKFSKKILRFMIQVLKIVLITVVANFFTLPIMWYFFGSVSLVAIISNILLSPITAVFLPLCVLAIIFGKLAYLGDAIVFFARMLSKLILLCVDLVANIRFGVVSLEYPFVTPLIVVFIVVMTVMLVIKLRKKLLICVPPIALVLSFAICFGLFAAFDKASVRYVGYGKDELMIVERAGVCSICDITDASSSDHSLISQSLPDYTVEIEDYIVTHPHKNHASMLERIYENGVIRKIYIPLIENPVELGYAAKIVDVAKQYNTEIHFYESGEVITLVDGSYLRGFFEKGNKDHSSVYLSIFKNDTAITYTDASKRKGAYDLGTISGYMLFGAHGEQNSGADKPLPNGVEIIFATPESAPAINGAEGKLIGRGGVRREFSIVLD